ncbi:MAG: TonB-dependent receptor plug domain-containing protein [Candidatus Cloacimonadota bacterium]
MKPACALLISLLGIGLLSAVDQDSLRTYTLNPIAVVADLPGQSIGTVDLVSITQGEEGFSLSLRDYVTGIPGVTATTGTKDESSIRIRGFRKTDLKVMVDGRPLTSGYFGNIDLNNILGSDISSVMIVKGPSSALYGVGTLGGTLNLLTKPSAEQKLFRLGLGLKRNNTNLIELSSGRDFGPWAYKISASRSHTDGFVLSDGFEQTAFENGGPRNNAAKTAYNLQASVESEVGLANRISFSIGYNNQDRKEVPSSIYEQRYRVYDDWYRSYSTMSGVFYLKEELSLLTSLYYDMSYDRYLEYNDPGYQVLSLDSRMHNHSLGINPRLAWNPSSALVLNTGFRLEANNSRRKDNAGYLEWKHSNLSTGNLFLTADYDYSSRIRINTSFGLSVYDLGEAFSIIPEPAISLSYGYQAASLTLSSGVNSAAPTMRQLFSSSTGNPDLSAQRALKTELSGNTNLSCGFMNLHFEASLFHNAIRDLIDLDQGHYANIYSYQSQGAELGILGKFGEVWELRLDYAYLDYEEKDGYILTESPSHSVIMRNNIVLPWGLSMVQTSSWTGERQSADSAGYYHELKPYWVHDLQLSREWNKYRFYLGLENFTDEDYMLEYGFPAGGMDFNLGMELSF